MATGTTRRESYGEWLGRQIVEQGFTIRGLARAWNPADPDTARRTLRRYLKGEIREPLEATRSEIAAVLGTADSGPTDPDEDEEEDLVRALLERVDDLALIAQAIETRRRSL